MEEVVRVFRVGWTYKETWLERSPKSAWTRGAQGVQTVSPVIPVFEVVKAEEIEKGSSNPQVASKKGSASRAQCNGRRECC